MLYVWSLSRSGWANAFYSAAAQAGGESWKAWFFGSSDVLGLVAAAALLAVHRQEDAASYTWVAAAVGSNSAAGYQLAIAPRSWPSAGLTAPTRPDARAVPGPPGRPEDPLVRRRWHLCPRSRRRLRHRRQR